MFLCPFCVCFFFLFSSPGWDSGWACCSSLWPWWSCRARRNAQLIKNGTTVTDVSSFFRWIENDKRVGKKNILLTSSWNVFPAEKVSMRGVANLTQVLDDWRFDILTQVKNLLQNDHQTLLPDYSRYFSITFWLSIISRRKKKSIAGFELNDRFGVCGKRLDLKFLDLFQSRTCHYGYWNCFLLNQELPGWFAEYGLDTRQRYSHSQLAVERMLISLTHSLFFLFQDPASVWGFGWLVQGVQRLEDPPRRADGQVHDHRDLHRRAEDGESQRRSCRRSRRRSRHSVAKESDQDSYSGFMKPLSFQNFPLELVLSAKPYTKIYIYRKK